MANSNTRHTVWLSPEAWDQVENHYRTDNCTTKNEYIEKAIRARFGLEGAPLRLFLKARSRKSVADFKNDFKEASKHEPKGTRRDSSPS